MTPPTPRVIANYRCHTGEGPMWHPDEQLLYWMDIPQGRLFTYDPVRGQHEMVREGRELGAATIQLDGSLMLMGGPNCCVSRWAEGQEAGFDEKVPGETRFNDAIADAAGRVYSGSMPQVWGTQKPKELGALYRLDRDGSIHVMDRGFGCVNGMAFADGGRTLYFIDSMSQNIYAYDIDPPTGDLANRRVFLQTADPGRIGTEGVPDGMILDAQGCLWVARAGGGCVVRYDPAGQEMMRLALPVRGVTSVAFGGTDLATLYITSSGGNDPASHGEEAGALFAVEIDGVHGIDEFRSQIPLP